MSTTTITREQVRTLIRESEQRDALYRRALDELRTIRMPDLREPLPIRPRRLHRLLVATAALIVATGALIGLAARSTASPGQCVQAGGWGGFCDSLPYSKTAESSTA